MQNPGFVTLNGHRIKVQRWQKDAAVLTFSTVIRGEHLGNDVMSALHETPLTLVLDEDQTYIGSARLLDRRASGAGTTAVIRLEIQFTIDPGSPAITELSPEGKLDAILAEVRSLRREVASLRAEKQSPMASGLAPTRPGTTMLDFEIPVDDDSSN